MTHWDIPLERITEAVNVTHPQVELDTNCIGKVVANRHSVNIIHEMHCSIYKTKVSHLMECTVFIEHNANIDCSHSNKPTSCLTSIVLTR
jgi:hypothetical protein